MLVCIGCRTRTAERIDVRTLERAGDVLACACGRRYPIIDGVPIVVADPGTVQLDRDLPVDVAELLAANGPDDAPYPRLLEHLSIYLDAHWGDGELGVRPFVDKIRALPRVASAVELGCSVGRIVAELPADRVVGVELSFGAIRRARQLLDGKPVRYGRRIAGRHYAPVTAVAAAVANRELVCADALDPPLVHAAYDRVVALNVLDSVRRPRQLLSVVDGLCAAGGEVILASPYAWQSGVVDEGARIGGADPATAVTQILREGVGLGARYRIEDEADLTWTLRRDARTVVTYDSHYVRARKL